MKVFKLSLVFLILLMSLFSVGCSVSSRSPAGSTQPQIDSKSSSGSIATETQTSSVPPSVTEVSNLPRTILTFGDLMDGFESDSPVDDAALAQPVEWELPNHTFAGRLELHNEETTGDMVLLQGNPNVEPEESHLPEFNFEFIQHEGYLIPIQRGLIITDHPYWNYILEPGRVWQENSDNGFSRASIPFALVWKGSNATLNGGMTFLFSDENISKVWYQITQETTIGYSADIWGLLEASYHHSPMNDYADIKDAFDKELAAKFPTRPIEQLSVDYPELDVSAFGRGVSPRNRTWYGFVINGVNYVSDCPTRYGEYPYCEYMRAPSYSTAKSAFVSVALMRLAQKYDQEAPSFLIKDHVPESSDSLGDWNRVTFDHVLDMATGNYESAKPMVDEEQWDTDPFWSEEFYTEKIAAAFNWPNSAEPGTQWVYRTFDTFIVTRALQNYLESLEGPEADIFEFVVEEVYKPLEMGPGVFTTLRTKDDNWQGQPYGGYGMWWIHDDLAKLSNFLNVQGGIAGGEQILHPDLLAAALQRDPDDRGVVTYPNGRYNNAFWANRYGEPDGFDCEFWVAEMQGYSGIVVVLMPNGASYYYASDGREFSWDAAIREADKIRPHCP